MARYTGDDYEGYAEEVALNRAEARLDRLDRQFGRVQDWRQPQCSTKCGNVADLTYGAVTQDGPTCKPCGQALLAADAEAFAADVARLMAS